MGLTPQAFKGNIEFLCDDIENLTGIRVNPTFNRKGAEGPVHHPLGGRLCRARYFYLHGLPVAV
jgi:hypothetical protein